MKILISEQDILNMVKRVLNEYHKGQQLILPFDGSSEPYNYMQFIEYIESIGTYGTINKPAKTFEECINNPELLENCGLNLLFDVDGCFDDYRTPELVKEIVNENGYDVFIDDIVEMISNGYDNAEDAIYDSEAFDFFHMDVNEFYSIFKDKGALREKLIENGRAELEWLYNKEFTTNESGQIYIERVIDIPDPMGRWLEKGNSWQETGEERDYFEDISKRYEGIGDCWTYINGAGDCYNTCLRNGTKINVKGWVNPENVNWEATIQLEQMDEYEIRLYSNIPVQIDEIEVIEGDNRGKRLPLKGSIVVKS